MEHPLLAALLVLCALASAGSAQPAEPRQGGYDDDATDQEMRISTTMIALLAAVVTVFFFILASIIYPRHCTGHSYPQAPRPDDSRGSGPGAGFSSFIARRQHRRAATRGLAAEVVEAFPTMRYAEAKALRVGKKAAPALECAVCLSESEDEDRLCPSAATPSTWTARSAAATSTQAKMPAATTRRVILTPRRRKPTAPPAKSPCCGTTRHTILCRASRLRLLCCSRRGASRGALF